MASNEVSLKILAETQEAIKSIESFASKVDARVSEIEKSTKSVSSAFDTMGNAVKLAIAAFSVDKIVGFFEKAIDEAQGAEAASNDLAFAFKQAGIASEGAVSEFEVFAKEIQKTTTVQDDAVIAIAAHIEQLTRLDKEGLKRATKAAVELSAILGIDLENASTQIVKAHSGHTESLKKLGFQFQKGKTDAETYENVLKEIEKSSGAAENKTKTFSGAVAQAKNNYSDIYESIGNVIIQNKALIAVINSVSDAFSNQQKAVENNANAYSGILSSSIAVAVEVAVALIDSFRALIDLSYLLARPFEALGLVLKNLFVTFSTLADTAEKRTYDFLHPWELVSKALNKSDQDLKNVTDSQDAYSKSIADTEQTFVDLHNKITGVTKESNNLNDANKKVVKSFSDIEDALPKDILDLQKQLEKVGKSQLDLIQEEKDKRIQSIKDAANASKDYAVQSAKDIALVEQDYAIKLSEYQKKLIGDTGKTELEKINESTDARLASFNELYEKGAITYSDLVTYTETLWADADAKKTALEQKSAEEAKKRNSDTSNDFKEKYKEAIKGIATALQQAVNVVSVSVSVADANKTIDDLKKDIPIQLQNLKNQADQGIAAMNEAIPSILDELSKELAAQGKSQEEIDAAVADRRKQLEDDIASQQLKNQDDYAKKEQELQTELDKKKEEADKKTIEAGQKTVSGLAGFIADKWIPGLGSVITQFLDAMFQGGSFLADAVNNVVNTIPGIITSIAEMLPSLIESLLANFADSSAAITEAVTNAAVSLIDNLPNILQSVISVLIDLIEYALRNIGDIISNIVTHLGEALGDIASQLPDIIDNLVNTIEQNFPELIKDLAKAIAQAAVNGLLTGIETTINGLIKTVNKIFGTDFKLVDIPAVKLAKGGTIPSGFNGDTFPALLSSGETVLPRDDVASLRDFLKSQENGQSQTDLSALVSAIDKSTEKNVTVVLKIDQRVLAKEILALNKQGFRVNG